MKKSLFILLLLTSASNIIKAHAPIYLHERIASAQEAPAVLETLIQHGDAILIFYSEGCGPCKTTHPIFESLANTFPNITFIKIKRSAAKDLLARYEIQSMPTILFFRNGTLLKKLTGKLDAQKATEMITAIY